MSAKLFTEDQIGKDRAYEIRIRDLKTGKQKSFSLFVEKGTKKNEYLPVESLKKILEESIKKV